MNRRSFCVALGATSTLAAARAVTPKVGGDRNPNIVYILADDLGWGDPDVYNSHSAIPTPSINSFAREGRRFTDMHSSSAVCTPSRYSILTGRYPWRSSLKSGITESYSTDIIEPGRMTVPSMLKQAGYYTAGVGKWHLGLGSGEKTDYTKPLIPGPVSNGFDYYFGIPVTLDMGPYLYFENDHVVEQATIADPGTMNTPPGERVRPGERAPHFDREQCLPFLTDKAIEVIKDRAAHPEVPFFLYFALPSPHTPWIPLPEYRGKSKAGPYGDWVVETDTMIGKVIDTLRSLGLADNTLVILTSDNGAFWSPINIAQYGHRANAQWRGEKADIWEAGHRIPFIVRWPGHIPANTVDDELGSLTDLMATLAALLHIELPPNAGEDSFNLLPALFGTKHAAIRPSLIAESTDGMLAIQEGKWKLECGLGSGGFSVPRRVEPAPGGIRGQLYDLSSDPTETFNVYAEHPDIVAHLTELLDGYVKSGHSRY